MTLNENLVSTLGDFPVQGGIISNIFTYGNFMTAIPAGTRLTLTATNTFFN